MKDFKFTREHITPEQNFKIITGILIKKGIITKEEIEAVQDQIIELQNAELDKQPGMKTLFGLMGGMMGGDTDEGE